MVDSFLMVLYQAMVERQMNADFICNKVNMCDGPRIKIDSTDAYIHDLLKEMPYYREPKEDPHRRKVKILQINDIHVDFNYTEVRGRL